jgi:hypothetical protein
MPAYGRKKAFRPVIKLVCKAAGQGCQARLHAMVQYADQHGRMVKLVENKVF